MTAAGDADLFVAKYTTRARDETPPSVSCGTADGAWHGADVAIACTADDSGSGLASPADASFSLVTNIAPGTETASALTTSRSVCDLAGNCVTAGPISGNRVDKKAPTVTVTTPATGAFYELNQMVAASYGCSELGSGLVSCVGTTPSSSPINTSSLGNKTFTVNASDAVSNAATRTVTYVVRRTLTAAGPAKVWFGVASGASSGLPLDVRIELLVNGVAVATGRVNNVSAGGNGFNNALLQTIAMTLTSGPVVVPAGVSIAVNISARRSCSASGPTAGVVRLWFDGRAVDTGSGRDAGTRVPAIIAGSTNTFYLRNNAALSTTAGNTRRSADVSVNSNSGCPSRQFVSFGTWSMNLP